MKDLGPLHLFLGVKFIQNQEAGVVWIGQPMYTEKILQRYGMYDSKPVSTPVNPDVKLVAYEKTDDVRNQKLYQAVVGSLLYLSNKTRPDIAYAVSCVSRFCVKPTKEHWTAVKRILRYLKGTSNFGLIIQRGHPSCNYWVLRCRLGWRCWRQKINLWLSIPPGRCCYQLEEQQTDLRGPFDC